MTLENKDLYVDYGKTDFYIKKCTIDISGEGIKVWDRNGIYNFTNDDIVELRITENEDYEEE